MVFNKYGIYVNVFVLSFSHSTYTYNTLRTSPVFLSLSRMCVFVRACVCARTDQILYGAVSLDEKKQITPVVYSNTIMSMKVLVEQATLLGEEVRFHDFDNEPCQVLLCPSVWGYNSMISITSHRRGTF